MKALNILRCLPFLFPFIGHTQCTAPYGITYSTAQIFNGGGYYYPNCIEFKPVSSSGNNITIQCTTPGTTNEFIGNDYVRITPQGTNEIRAQLVNNTTDEIRFRALNFDLDAAILEPVPPGNVNQYEKIEIGINYEVIDAKVDEFLMDPLSNYYKPATASYDAAFQDGDIINPYDPEHISVEAIFFRPSNPNQNGIIRYAFYHQTVTPDLNSNGDQTDWTKPNNLPSDEEYEWRVRFAPDEVGQWTGYLNIYIGGVLVQATNTFSFNVVQGTKPGFVKIAPNYDATNNQKHQFLYFSETDEPFVPVGDNYAWTDAFYPPISYCTTENCVDLNDHRIKPSTYEELTNYVEQTTNPNGTGYGANTTRLVMVPWGFEFEYEKLGNYSTRDIEMFEMDRYLNELEEKDLYIQVATHNFIGDQAMPNNIYNQNWFGNPYSEDAGNLTQPLYQYKGIAGVDDPIDFYTNADAIQLYKNRIRYFESRWGYSPNIYLYEILGEIDLGWDPNIPYWGAGPVIDPTMNNILIDWMDDMSTYMKNNLNSHMLKSTCYGSGAFLYFHNIPWADPVPLYSLPNMDIVLSKTYGNREGKNRIDQYYADLMMSYVPDKPLAITEEGPGQGGDWPADAAFIEVSRITDIADHNNTWASAFSGLCGPGLNWIWYRYGVDNCTYGSYTPNYSNEYEVNYGAVRRFLEAFNLKDHAYTPHSTLLKCPTCTTASEKQYETHYLKRSDEKVFLGWFHNRSYMHYNYPDGPTCTQGYPSMSALLNDHSPLLDEAPQHNGGSFYDEDNYMSSFPGPDDVFTYYPQEGGDYQNLTQGTLTLPGALTNTNYIVNWYWTWGQNGGLIYDPGGYSGNTVTSNSSGEIKFAYPPTGDQGGGNIYPGDWAFELIKVGEAKSVAANKQINSQIIGDIRVSPNPNSGSFTITSQNNIGSIRVTDMSGKLIYQSSNLNINTTNIELKNVDRGIYLVEVRNVNGQKPEFTKIIVE